MQKLHEQVSSRIVSSLEMGVKPWLEIWKQQTSPGLPSNALDGTSYMGINSLLLWQEAYEKGYHQNLWLTERQVKKLGGTLNGKLPTRCIYYSVSEVKMPKYTKSFTQMLPFQLYNVEQVEGVSLSDSAFYRGMGLRHNICLQRFLETLSSRVNSTKHMWRFEQPSNYNSNMAYYRSLFNSWLRWTGDKEMLGRLNEFSELNSHSNYDTSDEYVVNENEQSFEDLVCDIGAMFLCAEFGVTGITADNSESGSIEECHHDHEISSWIELHELNKHTLCRAATLAARGYQYLMSIATGEDKWNIRNMQLVC